MFKKISILALLLCSAMSFSQDMAGHVPMTLKKDRDVFQIVDNDGKKVILFISDKNNVKAVELDDKMQIVDSVTAYRPHKDYTNMIGYNNNGADYRLFWATSNNKEIFSQGFNFDGKKLLDQKFTMPLKGEKIVQKFSENNTFYILTALKDSNIVKLYTFLADGRMETKTLEFKNLHFFTPEYKRTDFFNYFSNESAITRINSDSPTSLTDSSQKSKFYFEDNKIVLTFDNNVDYTQMITIDMATFTATEKYIKQAYIPFNDRLELNSNSFLIDGKLFQVKIKSSIMAVTLKDLDDKLIKQYLTTEGQIMTFKNSDIIQENGDIKNTRILDQTSQFMRKINNANVALSCYRMGDNYLITLGSVTDVQNNSPIMYGAMFGVAGVMMAYAISNPVMDNFNAYANRKVVYINCLFDKNGNHVDGTLKPLAFDNIRKFISENKFMSSETLYKFEGAYYLGYYDSYEKRYELRKFTE